jgi:hypothetical protein
MRSVFPGDSSQLFVYRSPGASFCTQRLLRKDYNIGLQATPKAISTHAPPGLPFTIRVSLLPVLIKYVFESGQTALIEDCLTSRVYNNVRNLESQLFLRIVVRTKDIQQALLSSFLDVFIRPPLNTSLITRNRLTEPLSQTPPH